MSKNVNYIDLGTKLAGFKITDKGSGSSQISNLYNLLQSEPTKEGVQKLMLFTARQAAGGKLTHSFSKELVKELEKLKDQPQIALRLLTYINWANEIIEKNRLSTDKIKDLKSLNAEFVSQSGNRTQSKRQGYSR